MHTQKMLGRSLIVAFLSLATLTAARAAESISVPPYRVKFDAFGRMLLKYNHTALVTRSYAGMFGRLDSGSIAYWVQANRNLRFEKVGEDTDRPRLVLHNTGDRGVTMRREAGLSANGVELVLDVTVPPGVAGAVDTGFTLNPALIADAPISYCKPGSDKPIAAKLGAGADCLPYQIAFSKIAFDAPWGKLTIEFQAGKGMQPYGALLNGAKSRRNAGAWVQVLPLSQGATKDKPLRAHRSVCTIRYEPTGKPFLSPQRNVLYNGAFEDWSNPDLPDGWRRTPYADAKTSAGLAADATTQVDGKRSLRWSLDAGALTHATARSGYYAPAPLEAPVTFSLHLKSDPPGVRVRLVCGRGKKTVAATADWKRYEVVAHKGRSFYIRIEKLSPGTLWIDAAQLEEAGTATTYIARPSKSLAGGTPFPAGCMAKDLAKLMRDRPLLGGCGPDRSYYTTEAKGRLIYDVRLDPARLANAAVAVKLVDPNGATLKEAQLKPRSDGRATMEFDAAKLPIDASKATASLVVNGQTLATLAQDVVKRPRPASGSEVKVDRLTHTLIRNGKPYIPVGSDSSGSVERALECIRGQAANGFNQLHLWSGFYDRTRTKSGRVLPKLRPDDLRKILDAANAAGMTVTVNLSHWLTINHGYGNRWTNPDLSEDDLIEHSLEVVRLFRSHPAVLSWHLCDEPSPSFCPPKWLERAYREVQAVDPYHPAEINVCSSGLRMLSYMNTTDLMSIDIYPVPSSHVGLIAPHTRFMRLADDWRPIRWWIQAFASIREPTADEEICMTYQALVEGTRFFLFYNYRPTSYLAWAGLGQVASEIRTLTPALVAEEQGRVKVDVADERVIACWARVGKRVYVIAVNRDTQPMDAGLNLPAECAGKTAEVVFESRQVQADGALLKDRFALMARHVYVIDAE